MGGVRSRCGAGDGAAHLVRRDHRERGIGGPAPTDLGFHASDPANDTALLVSSASRLVIRAGLPPVRLHDLRHLAASLICRATRDLQLTSPAARPLIRGDTEQVYLSVVRGRRAAGRGAGRRAGTP